MEVKINNENGKIVRIVYRHKHPWDLEEDPVFIPIKREIIGYCKHPWNQ